MTEITATIPQQATAAAAAGKGLASGNAPFGALGFLNLILANSGNGIGLVPGQGANGGQGISSQLLQSVPGLQQALQGKGVDVSAALQALQNNSQINVSGGGLAGGVLAQLLANLNNGQQIPGLNIAAGQTVSHQLTGQEILQFDPTQLTIEQLISGELQSVTLPNGKEITQEQALLALLLKGRITAQPPTGATTGQTTGQPTGEIVPQPGESPSGNDISTLAGQIGDSAQQQGQQQGQSGEGEQDKPTRPEDTLAALLAATGQPPAPPVETPAPTGEQPVQAAPQTAGQNSARNPGLPPAPSQNGGQNGGQQQASNQQPHANGTANTQNSAPAPTGGEDAPRPDYEWRSSQAANNSQNNGQNTGQTANGRDTAIQSLLAAMNRAQPARPNGAPGMQTALNMLQATPPGLVAATDGAPGNSGFDLNSGGRGPFADADDLIEEMISQNRGQAGHTGEARPSQAFTSLLTTARSAASGHPATQTVAFQMNRMAANGFDRITLRLDPPELGRVEVRMEFSDDGKVKAHLIADRPDTLDTLQRDARSLERALQNAGLDTDGSSLTFDLRQGNDQHTNDPNDGRSRTAYRGPDAIDAADSATEVNTHVSVMPGGLAGSMRLDLLV